MPASAKRVIWKGAISFGLVHIPIALHAATAEHHLDFDWLDKRTMDHVGYKRINKRTGKEISAENIVKGLARGDDEYVILSPDEIAGAYPAATQTIAIEAFVAVSDISFFYLDRPYYVTPINKAGKVYALLRETLKRTGKAGVAKVVIQTRQHLALLVPVGETLMLELLRWSDEIRDIEGLDFPPEGLKAAGLSTGEVEMAEKLVDDMSKKWNPQGFVDTFKEQILELADKKAKKGKIASVKPADEEPAPSAKIYDLTDILRRSLDRGAKPRNPKSPAKSGPPAKRKTTASKAGTGTVRKKKAS